MTDYDTHAQERIAREQFHDATFALLDGHGAAHYWSRYHQAVAVVQDGSVETVALPVSHGGQRIATLGDWLEYTRSERGVEHHRVGGSLVDDLAREVRA